MTGVAIATAVVMWAYAALVIVATAKEFAESTPECGRPARVSIPRAGQTAQTPIPGDA
ncbi:hypothetical protein [Nocardia africana]|uniref:Uncharacterized protein n=1 Tax=Nocardia africana TaxID=134964 RepID=A0A378X2K6_9NOCA|nr:hypothetical protein [Nocardia africana]MCC3311482.1 hypothetical protein [Nocardia africana]SUA47257.1 Uncharacterised protein [Nocardia africana]